MGWTTANVYEGYVCHDRVVGILDCLHCEYSTYYTASLIWHLNHRHPRQPDPYTPIFQREEPRFSESCLVPYRPWIKAKKRRSSVHQEDLVPDHLIAPARRVPPFCKKKKTLKISKLLGERKVPARSHFWSQQIMAGPQEKLGYTMPDPVFKELWCRFCTYHCFGPGAMRKHLQNRHQFQTDTKEPLKVLSRVTTNVDASSVSKNDPIPAHSDDKVDAELSQLVGEVTDRLSENVKASTNEVSFDLDDAGFAQATRDGVLDSSALEVNESGMLAIEKMDSVDNEAFLPDLPKKEQDEGDLQTPSLNIKEDPDGSASHPSLPDVVDNHKTTEEPSPKVEDQLEENELLASDHALAQEENSTANQEEKDSAEPVSSVEMVDDRAQEKAESEPAVQSNVFESHIGKASKFNEKSQANQEEKESAEPASSLEMAIDGLREKAELELGAQSEAGTDEETIKALSPEDSATKESSNVFKSYIGQASNGPFLYCKICWSGTGGAFIAATKQEVVAHIEANHELTKDLKRHPCSQCSRKFEFEEELQQHMCSYHYFKELSRYVLNVEGQGEFYACCLCSSNSRRPESLYVNADQEKVLLHIGIKHEKLAQLMAVVPTEPERQRGNLKLWLKRRINFDNQALDEKWEICPKKTRPPPEFFGGGYLKKNRKSKPSESTCPRKKSSRSIKVVDLTKRQKSMRAKKLQKTIVVNQESSPKPSIDIMTPTVASDHKESPKPSGSGLIQPFKVLKRIGKDDESIITDKSQKVNCYHNGGEKVIENQICHKKSVVVPFSQY